MNRFIFNYLKNIWHGSAMLNNNRLYSLIECADGSVILDIGCDDGSQFTSKIKNLIKNSRIFGIDINLQALKKAKKRGIIIRKVDASQKLPFKANFFDLVLSNQIIEHLPDPDHLFSEVYRVLKPNGYFLISTENLSSWHNIFALILGWQPFSQDISSIKPVGNPFRLVSGQKPPYALHIKIFTLKSLCEIAQLHGYKIEEVFGAGYYPLPNFLSKIASALDPYHSAFIGLKARKTKEFR